MKIVIDIPEDVLKRTVFYREFRDLNDCITTIKALENAITLPEHHGDLIERNELLDYSYEIDSMYCMYDEVVNVDDIKNAPAIIKGSEK